MASGKYYEDNQHDSGNPEKYPTNGPGANKQNLNKTTDDEFFRLNDTIKDELRKADSMVEEVTKLHEKVLLSINDQSYRKTSNERDQLVNEINDIINKVKSDIIAMKGCSEEAWLSRTQKVSRAGRQQSLARNFSEFIQRYQQSKRNFNEKNRQRLKRQYLIAKPNASEEEIEDAINSDEVGNIFAQMVMKSSRASEARKVLKEVEERHKDIILTEKSIMELSVLFQEICDMIYKQQDAIDSIENAVEDAEVHIEVATSEVEKAIEYRRSSRKKLWFLLVVFFIILGITAGIVYVKVFKK
ncbi:hypothetical protein BB559_007589 [Furculomyces boomerangus]|uniref:t-SNARE coiled-coil homology domain-containing protein n=2 Tax=Harpellales TaxID=61421 RepID=A0A2T9XWS0_9FUNG|nr:hypothetical protein BB559_007589 [Furculomyces boomerangus]